MRIMKRKGINVDEKLARKIYPDMDDKMENAILRHMWSVAFCPPTCREWVAVSLADKAVSVSDWLPFTQKWEHRWIR